MPLEQLLFEQLLYECTVHYRDRGFPESALKHLRWVLNMNTRWGWINFQTELQHGRWSVKRLLGHFEPCPLALGQGDLSAAKAVFAFAFGYQTKQLSKGVEPTNPHDLAVNRTPGANNVVLAEQSGQLHMQYRLDLYLQWEVADAIGKDVSVEYATEKIDQGTKGVLAAFMGHAKERGKEVQPVVVVAHQHHYDRCRLLLEKQSIRVLRPPCLYSGYDPLEAQPRAMSPEECIVNDFASMAAMADSADQL